jgi:exopolysaccharide production protein ExoQ
MVSLGAGARRHHGRATAVPRRLDHDALFAFCMFFALLFMQQLKGLADVLFVVFAVLFVAPYARQWPRLIAPRAFLLIPPLLCIASAVWSEDPAASVRYGLQVLVTVAVGLGLSMAVKPRSALNGIFAAFAVYTVVAVAFGRFVSAQYYGETAFAGLNAGKNLMADIASTGAMVSTAVFVMALQSKSWARALIALAAFALEVYVAVIARSAGALISLAAGVTAFAALTVAARMPFSWRVGVATLTGLALLLVGVAANFLRDTVAQSAATLFDKDPTLTGRIYLWYRASDVIQQKPLMGHGYAAFWRPGSIDAEGLWRWAGVTAPTGFNFHNSGIELLVQLGWVGLVIIVGVLAIGVLLLARRQLVSPDPITAFWLSLLAFQLVRTPFESIFLVTLDFGTVLMFAALGSAFMGAWPAEPRPARRTMAHA